MTKFEKEIMLTLEVKRCQREKKMWREKKEKNISKIIIMNENLINY